MEDNVGQADLVVDRRTVCRIANPEGTDRQAGITGRQIAKQAVREIIDYGYAAIARKEDIDQCRPNKACATSNQHMRVRAEFNHVRAMVVQGYHPPERPVASQRTGQSSIQSRTE